MFRPVSPCTRSGPNVATRLPMVIFDALSNGIGLDFFLCRASAPVILFFDYYLLGNFRKIVEM